jgi:hypothetical protein
VQADHRSNRSNPCASVAGLSQPSIRTRATPNSCTIMPLARRRRLMEKPLSGFGF